jgi:3-phenylpropionate/trans-cinnamate dioxygenase ferredoxin component
MDWYAACAEEELRRAESVRLAIRPPVALFNLDGEFYATDDTCSHAESSLAEGYVEDGTVECILHFARFCIKTGAALSAPAVDPVRTYPVKVEDGQVWVDLSSRKAAERPA